LIKSEVICRNGDKDQQISNAKDMANFSASSGIKPEPYIIDKGGNNGDI